MPDIDWTKPLETVSGRSVKFLRFISDSTVEVLTSGDNVSRTYFKDGEHYYREQPQIRNISVVLTDQELADEFRKALQTAADYHYSLLARGYLVKTKVKQSVCPVVEVDSLTISKTITTEVGL